MNPATTPTPTTPRNILLLDNRDSFVYNLLDEFAAQGHRVEVYRNDVPAPTLMQKLEQTGALLVLSPGPSHPRDAGELMPLLRLALGHVPVLGICLGFQALLEVAGGAASNNIATSNNVVERVGPVHGEAQTLTLTQAGALHPLFAGLGAVSVARYHSLGTRQSPAALKSRLNIESLAEIDGICMAAQHCQHAALGFQFHPESILTPQGRELLRRAVTLLQAAEDTEDTELQKPITFKQRSHPK